MTKQDIDAVFERVRTWPSDRQACAAVLLLELERESREPYDLTEEEMAHLDAAEASGVASEADVRAVFGQLR